MTALEIAICGVVAFRPRNEDGLDLGFTYRPDPQRLDLWREDVEDAERWREPLVSW